MPIVPKPTEIQVLSSIPFEHDIVGLSDTDRDTWHELRAQRAACLTQAAARANRGDSTDEQIATYHENVWHLMRHVVPREELWHQVLNLVVGEGHSFEKLSSEILSRDERILPYVDEAIQGHFGIIALGDDIPEWRRNRDPMFMQLSVLQLLVGTMARRLSPSVDAIVDHILGRLEYIFQRWGLDPDALRILVCNWFRELSREEFCRKLLDAVAIHSLAPERPHPTPTVSLESLPPMSDATSTGLPAASDIASIVPSVAPALVAEAAPTVHVAAAVPSDTRVAPADVVMDAPIVSTIPPAEPVALAPDERERSPSIIFASDLPPSSDDEDIVPEGETDGNRPASSPDNISQYWKDVIATIINDDLAASGHCAQPMFKNPDPCGRDCLLRSEKFMLPLTTPEPKPLSSVDIAPALAPSLIRWATTDWREWPLAGRASTRGGLDGRGESLPTLRHALPTPAGWTREEDRAGHKDWGDWLATVVSFFEGVDAETKFIELPPIP